MGATVAFATEEGALRAMMFDKTPFNRYRLDIRPRVFGNDKGRPLRGRQDASTFRRDATGYSTTIKASRVSAEPLTDPIPEGIRPHTIPFDPKSHPIPAKRNPWNKREKHASSARPEPRHRISADALNPASPPIRGCSGVRGASTRAVAGTTSGRGRPGSPRTCRRM